MSDKPTSSIRLVAWKIAEEFKTLPRRVFKRAIELDNQKKKWWEDEKVKPVYKVGIAAHVAENLMWWTLSEDEKRVALVLEKIEKGNAIVLWRGKKDKVQGFEITESNVAAQEIFQNEFPPFHEAFLEGGLPDVSHQSEDLGDVIARTQDKALIVAFLLGLDAIYKGETCAQELHKLAKDAAEEASKGDDDWRKFKARAKEVVRQLPLDPALYVAPQD